MIALMLALLAAVPALLALTSRRRTPMRSYKSNTITLTFSQTQMDLICRVAHAHDTEVQAWALATLLRALPSPTVGETSEQAFAQLDKQDTAADPGVFPLPQDKIPEPPEEKPTVVDKASKHPCVYNVSGTHPLFSPSDTYGRCRHHQQPGRPCVWNPQAFRNCPYNHNNQVSR